MFLPVFLEDYLPDFVDFRNLRTVYTDGDIDMPVEIVGVQMTEIERLLHPDTEQVALFPGVAGRAIVTHRKGVKGTGLICHRHIESHPDGIDPGIAGRLEVDVVLTVAGESVAEHRRFAHTVPSRNE